MKLIWWDCGIVRKPRAPKAWHLDTIAGEGGLLRTRHEGSSIYIPATKNVEIITEISSVDYRFPQLNLHSCFEQSLGENA